MRMKALLLSALILAPSAGAAAAQSASTQDFRVQINKALAAPAQDFRLSYTSVALSTTPAIFVKSNLLQALSDEELDEVKGEFVVLLPAAPAAAGAISAGAVAAGAAAVAAGAAVGSWLGNVLKSDSAQQKPLTSGDIKRLKENDIDPHELKQSGSGGRVSDKDLYKDREGNVYVKPKGGQGPGEPTNVNLKNLP